MSCSDNLFLCIPNFSTKKMNLCHAKFVIILKGEIEKRKTMSCDKFEKLFTQDDETELLKHIQECDECRKEYEKFQKVGSLVKEAKPLFEKEKSKSITNKIALSMVAGVSFFILTGFVLMSWLPNYNYDKAVESDIYPVDEYGLVELF